MTDAVMKGEIARKVPVDSTSARARRVDASTTSPMPQTTERTRKVWRPMGTSWSLSKADTFSGSVPAER